MYRSLPFSPREVKATEQRLDDIYKAAYTGLKGDSLALAANMLPSEFRALCQLDPMAELAAQKGRADNELEMATTLINAARQGDVKAATTMLQMRHDWYAKQHVSLDVTQQISVIAALEEAQRRVEKLIVDGDVEPEALPAPTETNALAPRARPRPVHIDIQQEQT